GIRRRGDIAIVGPITLRPFARPLGTEVAVHAFAADVARRAGARTVLGLGAEGAALRRAGWQRRPAGDPLVLDRAQPLPFPGSVLRRAHRACAPATPVARGPRQGSRRGVGTGFP